MKARVPSLHLPRLMDYGWECQPLLTPSPVPFHGRALDSRRQDEQEREFEELWRIFQELDCNRDGLICKGDIAQMLLRLDHGLSDREAAGMIEAIDEDGDGFVDFGEFSSLFGGVGFDPQGDEEEEEVVEAFKVFDRNGDGFITAEELHAVLSKLGLVGGGENCCSRMIRMVDSNGDGRVDLAEFKRMMGRNLITAH